MNPIDIFNATCNDARRREQEINVGFCRDCKRNHAVNADDLCMACEFTGDVTRAFPKTESYTRNGVTVLDMSRVDLFGKP